ncbi:hypothetical protein HYV49_02225 [Candidatus Pacearchaeota archaeon]|nr:hypothetical protein [Candidatus Pacearchaeota archaeon]
MARQKRNLNSLEEIVGEEKTAVKSNKHKAIAGFFLLGFIALAFVFFFFSDQFTGLFIALEEEIRYKISTFVIAVFLLFVIMIAFILYWYIKLSSFVVE